MCPRTWVPCALEDAHPPGTPLGPQAQAYGGVLGGCVFLQVRSSCTCRVLGGRCFLWARYPCSLFFSHARRPVAAPTRTPVCSQRFLSHTSPPPVRPYSSPTCMPRNLWWGMGVSYERGTHVVSMLRRGSRPLLVRFRVTREQLESFQGLLPESQGRTLALTVLCVPSSLSKAACRVVRVVVKLIMPAYSSS